MKPDPMDQLGARLFEVAREEPLPAGAVERAIRAARRDRAAPSRATTRRRWWFALAVPVAAGAAAIAFRLGAPEELVSPISAEPSAARGVGDDETDPPAIVAPPPSAVAPPPPSAKPALKEASAPMTLSDELDVLKRVQTALDAGDARRALAQLDRYDRAAKGQRLRAEATLLRIEALARSGQRAAAAELARRFVEQDPGSPLVDRARSFAGEDLGAAGGQSQNGAAGGQPQKEE